MILVINKNAKYYTDMYKLFYHKQEAIDHADGLGYSKNSMVGDLNIDDLEIGRLLKIDAKDCNIEIMVIEPECKLEIPKSVYGC